MAEDDTWQAINDSADAYVTRAYQQQLRAPNPQVFVDSATAGAVPSVIDAFGSQDPAVDKLMSATPAGTVPSVGQDLSTQQPDLSAANVQGLVPARTFDEKSFLADQANDIRNNKNGMAKWKGLGEAPVANMDYLKGLVNSKDKDRIKRYQTYLVAHGFGFDPESKSKNPNPMSASGSWDDKWLNNLQQFLQVRWLPEAMWGRNEQTRKAAHDVLLNALDMDTDKLPKLDDNNLASIINSWVHTNGDSSQPRDSLQDLVDKYGEDVLDKAHSSILHPGFTDWLGGTLHSVGSMLAGYDPGQFGVDLPIPGFLKKIQFGHSDISDDDLKGMDDNTKAIIKDMSNNAQKSDGLFGFMDTYDKKRGQALITAKYLAEGAAGAITGRGDVVNPHDAWNRADAHTDDVWHELFGKNFVTDAPFMSSIGNFAINVLDDPLTYAGGIGLDYKVDYASLKAGDMENALMRGRGVLGTGITFRAGPSRTLLWTNPTIRSALTQSGRDGLRLGLDTILRPHLRARQEMLKIMMDQERTPQELSVMLGVNRDASFEALVKAKKAGPSALADYLENFHGHKLLEPSTMKLMAEAGKIYGAQHWNRISVGRQAHLLDSDIRGENHIDDVFRVSTTAQARDAIWSASKVFGFDKSETDELFGILFDFDKDPTHRASELTDKIKALFDQKVVQGEFKSQAALDQALQQARGFIKFSMRGKEIAIKPNAKTIMPGDEGRFYLPVEGENGKTVEASTLDSKWKYDNPASQASADTIRKAISTVPHFIDQTRQSFIDKLIKDNEAVGVKLSPRDAEDMLATTPEYVDAVGHLQEQVKDLVRQLRDLPGRSGVEGKVPVAAFSSQFEDIVHLPIRPYDLLVARSPGLRRAEWFQAASHINDLNALWKKAILTRLSTAIRINFGDETSRTFIYLMNRNPAAAVKFLGMKVKRDRGSRSLPDHLRSDLSRYADMERPDYVPFKPTDSGYTQNSWNYLNNIVAPAPETKIWTNGIRDGGEQKAMGDLIGWLKNARQSQMDADWMRSDIEYLTGEAKKPGADQAFNAKEIADRQAKLDTYEQNSLAAEFLRRQGVDPGNHAQVALVARAIHTRMKIATRYHPTLPGRQGIFDHVFAKANGEKGMSRAEWGKFVGTHQGDAGVLPLVVGHRPYTASQGAMGRMLNSGSDYIHNKIISSMVNKTRQTTFNVLADERAKIIKKWFGDSKSDDEIEEMAIEEASHLTNRITYQFQRSMLGQAVRNVFPFWGATASMSRFWIREAVENPLFAREAAEMLKEIDKRRKSKNPIRISIPFTGWIMQHMGMTGADNISMDPTHLAFFAADGYEGFFPSIGGLAMAPLKMAAHHDPDLEKALKDLPGGSYIGIDSPMFPYLDRIVAGTQMVTGHDPTGIPIIGGDPTHQYDKAIAQETEAEEAAHLRHEGPEPTRESVLSRVGEETIFRGVAQGLVPFQVQAGDEQIQKAKDAEKAVLDSKSDKDKLAALRAHKEMAPLVLYKDRDLVNLINPQEFGLPARIKDLPPAEIRDAISTEYPWVTAYVPTTKTSTGGSTYNEISASKFTNDLKDGRIKYLSTPEILDKVHNQINIRDGYLEYNRANSLYQQALIYYGVTPQSAEGKAFKKSIVTPVLDDLQENNEDWTKHFNQITSNSPAGLRAKSADMMTIASWEVLPHNEDPSMSTPEALKTQNSWRQFLSDQNELAAYLHQITADGASPQDKQLVKEAFRQRVAMIASHDPGFAAMIRGFSTSQLDQYLEAGAA